MVEKNTIKVLNDDLIGKIAAGEIIERPSSVIKELVENSIDADSTRIKIEIANGGKSQICVTDDGIGMSKDDAELAFQRHATSKIKDENDLYYIKTLGFRGEALPSIGAVSRVELSTRQPMDEMGVNTRYEGGRLIYSKPIGAAIGTAVIVKDLFYNVPARYKYLKTSIAEGRACSYMVSNLALAHPEISFQYARDGKEQLSTPGNGILLDAISSVYGHSMAANMMEIHYSSKNVRVKGYISKPEHTRKSRSYQSFFVNGRYFYSSLIRAALENGFKEMIPRGRFPAAIIYIEIDPEKCDVNVHPAKMEIKFEDESSLYKSILYAAKWALANASPFNVQGLSPQPSNSGHSSYGESVYQKKKTDEFKEGNCQGNYWTQRTPQPGKDDNNDKYIYSGNKLDKVHNIYNNDIIDNSNNISMTESCRIIGQLHATYILAETEGGLLLIDQHAAHERIRYEQLLEKKNKETSQNLLMPVTIELDTNAYNKLEDKIHVFTEMGFDMENFGSNTFIIRAVPAILRDMDVKGIITDIVDEMEETKRDEPLFVEKLNCILACKSAVKAGQRLSREEMTSLVSDLFKSGDKYTCPHGRPAAVKYSFKEINKNFARE